MRFGCVSVWPLDDCATMDMMTHRMRATAGLSESTKTTELYDTSSRSIVQGGGLGKRAVCKNIGDSRGDLTKRPSPDLSERSSSWPSRQRVDGSEQADGRTPSVLWGGIWLISRQCEAWATSTRLTNYTGVAVCHFRSCFTVVAVLVIPPRKHQKFLRSHQLCQAIASYLWISWEFIQYSE